MDRYRPPLDLERAYAHLARQIEAERRARWTQLALVLLLVSLGISLSLSLRPGETGYTGPPPPAGPLPDAGPPREVTPRGELSATELNQIKLFQEVSPSVVFVTNLAVRRDLFRMNATSVPRGTGTGFVWDEQGHVVTNVHVLAGADSIEVTLADGSNWSASYVGGYPDKDIAVLRIQPDRKLRPVKLGSSHDLSVGQFVYALGNPFGLDHTLTSGIVSALGREIEGFNGRIIEGVIQTDAAINPGNSGGPLLDSAGRVVGVNTAILSESGSSSGIGFAVPIDTVRRVVEQVIRHGRYVRPSLGVQLAPDSVRERAELPEGALVRYVDPRSHAGRAGLIGFRRRGRGYVAGDLIVRLGERAIRRSDDLMNALENYKPGDEVELGVWRDGQERVVKVTLSGS